MKELLNLLKKYEFNHAPKCHPSGETRFPHWYILGLYTDGSGFIKDTCGESKENPQIVFRFQTFSELEKELLK